MKRVVFLGAKSVGYECLRHIIELEDSLSVQVVAISFNPNAGHAQEIKELAESKKIQILENLDDILSLKDIDLILSIQYHKILKKEHLAVGRRAINLHMAPLPEYRGCNQFSFAIIDQSTIFGTTLHEIDEGVDSGSIIAESRFEIPENCFVSELHDITVQESIKLFKDKVKELVDGSYKAVPQSHFTNRPTSFHKRSEIEDIKKIDMDWPREKIERYLRATLMPGFEGPYFYINNKKISFSLEKKPE